MDDDGYLIILTHGLSLIVPHKHESALLTQIAFG